MEEQNIDYSKLLENISDSEFQVGITEYLNPGQQILGISKYRLSDFIVNEIEPETKQAVFYDKNKLKKEFEYYQGNLKAKKEEEEQENQVEKTIKECDRETAVKYFGQENVDAILKFYSDWENGEKVTFFELQCEAPQEKEDRRAFHEFVRNSVPFFDSRLENGKITLKFVKSQAKKKKFTNKQLVLRHVKFTLHKFNIDTNNAISQIAQYLRLPSKIFGMAGIKDKRGYTTQKLVMHNLKTPIEHIVKALYSYKGDQLNFCDVNPCDKPMRIGDLYGNRFSIALRLLESNEQVIKENIDNLAKDGFINYYGMQRFGNISTHIIGMHILRQEYKEAIDTILFKSKDSKCQKVLKQYQEDKDTKKALEELPRYCKIERSLILAQQKFGEKDYCVILQTLPRSMRDLYPHAYQSFVWNKLASLRMKKFGKKLAIGDIVAKDKKQIENINGIMDNETQEQQVEDEQESQQSNKYKGINEISYEYIDENNINQYTIQDILIPIFGVDLNINYDKFNLGNDLLQILKEDGISLLSIQEQRKQFFITGGFRTWLFSAENVEYKTIRFNEKSSDFLTPFYMTEQDKDIPQGKFCALVARFTLQKGCYATMLMRELTKVSSAIEIQMKLNDEFQKLDDGEEEQTNQCKEDQEKNIENLQQE